MYAELQAKTYCINTEGHLEHGLIIAYYILDPCDRITCNGTNAMCEMIFATGTPICVCPEGMKGGAAPDLDRLGRPRGNAALRVAPP